LRRRRHHGHAGRVLNDRVWGPWALNGPNESLLALIRLVPVDRSDRTNVAKELRGISPLRSGDYGFDRTWRCRRGQLGGRGLPLLGYRGNGHESYRPHTGENEPGHANCRASGIPRRFARKSTDSSGYRPSCAHGFVGPRRVVSPPLLGLRLGGLDERERATVRHAGQCPPPDDPGRSAFGSRITELHGTKGTRQQ
jgi:hypothetical protein